MTISIVTPSFNQGRFLEWTLRSVLLQDFAPLEYVVMDGGSSDQTGEILSRYRSRLTHVESAPDGGQADAVARGFAHTTGEIMAYLNSDDMLAPGALEFVSNFFEHHPRVDALYSHRVFVDEENVVNSYWILPPHSNWLMKRWDYIPQETCFWRRRIYDKAGGIDASFEFALDYDLFARFMEHGRLVRANRFLGAFRRHSSSKTAGLTSGHPEIDRVRAAHHVDPHWLPERLMNDWILRRSRKFAARAESLPGALPGTGYNYDRLWEGRLTDQRFA